MKGIKLEDMNMKYSYWFHVNKNFGGWRSKVGSLLRGLAEQLDGRISVAIDMGSMPGLTEETRNNCIKAGFKTMKNCLVDEVRAECMERVMEKNLPHLYDALN